jgi:hypothetical protein
MWNASAVNAAIERVGEGFQNDDAGTLAQDESVASSVERPRRSFG